MDRNQTQKILMKDEVVLHTFKPYFRKELLSVVLGALALGLFFIPFGIGMMFDQDTPYYVGIIILAVYGVIFILMVLLQLLAFRNRFYTVTDKRFIIQKGLFGIDFSSIPIEAVQFLSVNVSVIDKILNKGTGSMTFGTVSTPVTSGQPPRFIFSNILEVYENYKVLKELIDEKTAQVVKE
ncbi:MAG TPA: PH domain-containing protein [Acholeplasmataceae bacterium]|nr:PH domain-containing protein [Acholeplasmataceae bacterium]HQC30896.1 PH domain-containing protein [Acholeplasmataceae bacterium]